MPKSSRIDFEKLVGDLRKLLINGPTSAVNACRYLGISQSTFSRILARFPHEIFVVGRASKTRYALKRTIPEVGQSFVIYRINEDGKTERVGNLHGISPNGFYYASDNTANNCSRFFEDLPYFLDDLRPNGFLGRLIPPTHPDLNLPKDINYWSANDCLKYLTRYGCDSIGNLILGDDAFGLYLKKNQGTQDYVQISDRDKEYPKKAIEVLQYGDPGSSAGGEQPKFPAVIGPELKPVLVKFSPKIESDVSQRRADLLICEHISLEVLKNHGQSAAKSTLIFGGNQVFLETERFDRTPQHGRKGLISLGALSSEFVGKRGSWTMNSEELLRQQLISKETYDNIRWREIFGHLIGNTDMHLANISFYFQIADVLGLAPAYDMLPMLYAPQNEQLVERNFNPPLPKPADAEIWKNILMVGIDFWALVGTSTMISSGFRKIAKTNLKKVRSLEHMQNLLP